MLQKHIFWQICPLRSKSGRGASCPVFFSVDMLDFESEKTYGQFIDCSSIFFHDGSFCIPCLIDLVLH